MPDRDRLAARVAGHADTGDRAVGRAMEAALAAQRLYDAAAEKSREVVRHLADAGAAFSSVRAASAVPAHEPTPDAPRRAPDSARLVPALALALSAVGLSAWGTDRPTRTPEATVTGQTALREGLYYIAEKTFDAAGDDLGRAEALVCQGRYADAERLLEHDGTGPGLRIRALAARGRGDRAAFAELIRRAAALDDRVACRLVATHAAGG